MDGDILDNELYKQAFLNACERLEELDKVLYSLTKENTITSSNEYMEIILNRTKEDLKRKIIDKKESHISEITFEKFQHCLQHSNDDNFYKNLKEQFGNSFFFYDDHSKKYVCYDYLGGENGIPNIEEIKDRENAIKWLGFELDIEQILEIERKSLELNSDLDKEKYFNLGESLCGADIYAVDLELAQRTGRDIDGADIPDNTPEERTNKEKKYRKDVEIE